MMKFAFPSILLSGIISGIISLSAFASQATNSTILSDSDIANMSMANKMQAQLYFKSHSFDFPKIFSAYHPGPYWILKKTHDFNLTDTQVKQEEELKIAMARSTLDDETALKQAYETYTADAAKVDPDMEEIMSDIEVIGKTQTRLASEMVNYHLKGYALLTPGQKKIYQKLVSEKTK
ncbi:MAG: hypothetical protein ACYCSS_10520 [Sulfuriferula sp.]